MSHDCPAITESPEGFFMRVSIEAPRFAVFNAERFKRYALLVAYHVHNVAEKAIERLEEECDAKAQDKE
jgi:hypothetical protein